MLLTFPGSFHLIKLCKHGASWKLESYMSNVKSDAGRLSLGVLYDLKVHLSYQGACLFWECLTSHNFKHLSQASITEIQSSVELSRPQAKNS